MANEIVLPPGNDAGLTVTAKVFDQSGSQVGSNVSCSEVGSTSIYRGTMPTASQAVYFVEFEDSSSQHLGTYEMDWTGSVERTVFDTPTTAQVNAEVDTALVNYAGPTKTEMDTFQTAVTNLINALNNISPSEVNTQVDTALADYNGPTKAEMDTFQTAITNLLNALNNISPSEVNTQVDNALADYDGPTKTEMDALQTAIAALINGLNNISTSEVNTEVDTALADYDGPTKAEMDAFQTAVTNLLNALNNISLSSVRTQVDSALTSYDPSTGAELTAAVTSIKGSANRDNTEVYNNSGAQSLTALQNAIDAVKVIVDKFNFNSANDVKSTLDGEEVTTDAASRNASKADVALLATINTAIAALNDISPVEVLSQATSAITTYDPPTKTEMNTFQVAITALINGLHNLSAAQVNNEMDTALADYDAPTKTEMDAGFAGLNNPTAAEIVTAMSAMVIEGSLTFVQYMRAVGAVLAGDGTVSVDGGTVTYKSPSGIKNVATATVDVNGNRDVTLDLT